jgi:hypothetical protein
LKRKRLGGPREQKPTGFSMEIKILGFFIKDQVKERGRMPYTTYMTLMEILGRIVFTSTPLF